MKTLSITLILLFVAIAGTVYATNDKDVKVSEVRKVEAFSSVDMTSVATVYFTQSDTYSLKIEGKEEYVKNVSSSVEKGCLTIGFKNKKEKRNGKQGVTIYLSAPDLKKVEFTGVGSFNCKTPLKLDDVKFEVEGVGNLYVKDLTCTSLSVSMEGVGDADIHVNCDHLRASVEGVGSVKLSGVAGTADISKSGIGSVNTRNLKVGR